MYIPSYYLENFTKSMKIGEQFSFFHLFMDCVRNIADRPECYFEQDVEVVYHQLDELIEKMGTKSECTSMELLLFAFHVLVVKYTKTTASITGVEIPKGTKTIFYYFVFVEYLKNMIIKTNNYIPEQNILLSKANDIIQIMSKLPNEIGFNEIDDLANQLFMLIRNCEFYDLILTFEYIEDAGILPHKFWKSKLV